MTGRIADALAVGVALYSLVVAPGFPACGPEAIAPASSDQGRNAEIRSWDISGFKPGTSFEIVLFRSGRPISAKYLGMETIPEDAYAQKYAQALRAMSGAPLPPKLGESIALVDTLGKSYEGTFRGFDMGALLLSREGEERPARVNLPLVVSLRDAERNPIDVGSLIKRLNNGEIPFRTMLILETRAGRMVTPLDEIALISPRSRRTSPGVVLLIVSALIGIPAIIVIASGNLFKGMRLNF